MPLARQLPLRARTGRRLAALMATLQRCAGHLTSRTDITEAYQVGGAAAWAILSLAFAYVASAIQESFGRSVVIAFAMLIVHVALIALIARKRA